MPKRQAQMTPGDLFQELLEGSPTHLTGLTTQQLEELKEEAAIVTKIEEADEIPGLVSAGSAIYVHGTTGEWVRATDRVVVASAGTCLRGILIALDFVKGVSTIKPKENETFEPFVIPVHYLVGYFALLEEFGTADLSFRQGAVIPVLFRDKISGHRGGLASFQTNLANLKATVSTPPLTAAYAWTLSAVKQVATRLGNTIQWFEITSDTANASSELSRASDPRKNSVFVYALYELQRFLNRGIHPYSPGVPGVLPASEWQDSYGKVQDLIASGLTVLETTLYESIEPAKESEPKALSDSETQALAKEAKQDLGL